MSPIDAPLMYPNEMIKLWLKEHGQQDASLADPSQTSEALKAKYPADIVCLSHQRWDLVYQRPQHLLSRAAQTCRVFFVEEPVFDEGSMRLDIRDTDCGVKVVVPRIPDGLQSDIAKEAVLRQMVDRLVVTESLREYVLWYCTPMALDFTRHLKPSVTVVDCMAELSAFTNAPNRLKELEEELFTRADLVFTGGHSLYEVKKSQHPCVHAFPNSIDRDHFAQARVGYSPDSEPLDQKEIPHPRFGFFGVIDERLDIDLLTSVAEARPDWQFVMIGPVVRIDPETLPLRTNIHYLGPKHYRNLPSYLAGWDVAVLFFARNEATRFVSPAEIAEYLAAGKSVISTSVTDVLRPYGEEGLVEIADNPDDFILAGERLLEGHQDKTLWIKKVDAFISQTSWERTWSEMWNLIEEIGTARQRKPAVKSSGIGIYKVESADVAGAV